MNTLSSKLSAFAAALAMNSLIFCAVGYVFIRLFVTETKGKTLEQLEQQLAD